MPLLCNSGCGLIAGMLLTLCVYQGAGNGEALVGSGAEPLLGSSPCDCSADWQKLKNSWKLFLLYLLRMRYIFNSLSAVRAHIQSRSRDVGWTAIFPASTFRSQSGEVWFSVPRFNSTCASWAFPLGQPPGEADSVNKCQVCISQRTAIWGWIFVVALCLWGVNMSPRRKKRICYPSCKPLVPQSWTNCYFFHLFWSSYCLNEATSCWSYK